MLSLFLSVSHYTLNWHLPPSRAQEGQGLGKAGQGIARALAVEKTSKRGGRIIHERDVLAGGGAGDDGSPAPPDLMPPPPPPPAEPTMAEILRSPTKIVMLRVRMQERD